MHTSRELTPSEQGWLRHLRRAQEQGGTLVDYARSAGVKVGSLYEARHTLARKGVQLPGATPEISPRESAEFITVHVEPSAVPVAGEPVCRLRHPGGWVIECTNWPVASWVAQIAALVQEALGVDPFSGSVFGFINKRRTKLRLLVWEKNGFILWTKSLVEEKFPWPRQLDVPVVTLTGEQLNWLLDGYDVWKMKPHKTLNYSYAS